MPRFLFMLLLTSTTYPAQASWYLFARDDGCTDMQIIVRRLKLARAPASPEDFAQMMRDRGDNVIVGLPSGISTDLAGKLVQVQFGNGKALIFVNDEICRSAEFGRK